MTVRILRGDCRDVLPTLESGSVQCCVTSPPYYGLRNYGVAGQIGLEKTVDEYICQMVIVFREVRRCLRDDGTLWLNIGDSYASGKGTCFNPGGNTSSFNVHLKEANVHPLDRGNKSTLAAQGMKPKDLIGVPWMLAFALRADGWYLRQDIIWAKPNPMPESVCDRCTKSHEYIFLLAKSERYYYDQEAIREPYEAATLDRFKYAHTEHVRQSDGSSGGASYLSTKANGKPTMIVANENGRNKRSVWTVATQPFKEAHFATFPPALIEPCILAGCPRGGVVLDPFGGAGTTGLVADRLQRSAILIELNSKYAAMAEKRIHADGPLFSDVTS